MEFTKIDTIHGETLDTGDVVKDDDGNYHVIKGRGDDEDDLVMFHTYNLSTGDDDDNFMVEPYQGVELYQAS